MCVVDTGTETETFVRFILRIAYVGRSQIQDGMRGGNVE